KFLEIERIVGVYAAIEDVHHRYGKKPRRRSADITVERRALRGGRGLGNRERDSEDRVGAEPALVRRTVERDERLVDLRLRFRIHAADGIENLAIDGGDGFAHALAQIALATV